MSLVLYRLVLAAAAVVITVPGLRQLVDPASYVESKDNLVLTADLSNDLRASGATFVAVGLVLLAGAAVAGLRWAATLVGVVAFLPQGLARVGSYLAEDGQHDSYLRAGVVEIVVGLVLLGLLFVGRVRPEAMARSS